MLLDLIAPPICGLCKEPSGLSGMDLGICLGCLLLEYRLCDTPESKILIRERMWSSWVAAGYRLGGGAVKSLIYKFKYAGRKKVAFLLGREVALGWQPPEEEFQLVPVPIHRRRKMVRGYNQTEAIARGMSSVWGTEVNCKLLQRSAHRKSLTSSGRWKRADELEGVIELTQSSHSTPVVLVDDVLTTGATLRACRDILENANIRVIGAAVIALA